MIGFGDGDLAIFTGDMGVDVIFAGVTVRGTLDETDLPAVTSDGAVEGIVHGTTLTVSAPDRARLTGLTIDSIISADGRYFTVREFLRIDDGKFWHIMLAETTQAPPVAVARIVTVPRTFSVTPQGSQALSVTLEDADGNVLTDRAITFESADTSKASVDSDGVVLGVGLGEVAIIIRSEGAADAVVCTASGYVDPYSSFALFDSVTRPDAASVGTPTEKGDPYTIGAGTWAVDTHRLKSTSAASGDHLIVTSVGHPSRVLCDTMSQNFGNTCFVPAMFYIAPSTLFVWDVFGGGGQAVLYKGISGTYTMCFGGTIAPDMLPGETHTTELRYGTLAISAYVDDVLYGTYTLTSGDVTVFGGASKVAFFLINRNSADASTARLDNLKVVI